MSLVFLKPKPNTFLSDHEFGFQPDGQPTMASLAGAIEIWARLQDHMTLSVADASSIFNIPPERVRLAVSVHPSMSLDDRGGACLDTHLIRTGAAA